MLIQILKVCAVFNILAGIALVAFWYLFAVLLPYRELSDSLSILVNTKYWSIINGIGAVGALMALIGLFGIFMSQIEAGGWLGVIGFLLGAGGIVMLLVTLVWDTVLWPILVDHDPSLLDFTGPIYSSKTFLPYFIMAGSVFSLGLLLFGISIVKAGVLPSWGGILMAVGAPLFGLGAMFGKMQVIPRTAGVTLLSIGLIIIGWAMLGK